jgi:hypothetical protein
VDEILDAQNVRPRLASPDQSRSNWILANVVLFFAQTFVMPQAMIEKVSLPFDAREPRGSTLEIANDAGQRSVAFDRYQHVQMVGHQNEQLKKPAARGVITASALEDGCRRGFGTKLINTAALTAIVTKNVAPKRPAKCVV